MCNLNPTPPLPSRPNIYNSENLPRPSQVACIYRPLAPARLIRPSFSFPQPFTLRPRNVAISGLPFGKMHHPAVFKFPTSHNNAHSSTCPSDFLGRRIRLQDRLADRVMFSCQKVSSSFANLVVSLIPSAYDCTIPLPLGEKHRPPSQNCYTEHGAEQTYSPPRRE